MKFILLLLTALAALAQAPAVPEVRGTIFEVGTDTPVAGVEVSLNEFAPNADNFIVNKVVVTTFTDPNGAFSLKPGHLGTFTVSTKKESYTTSGGRQVVLTDAARVQSLRMTLTRPAGITGRVVDVDGQPVRNLRVEIVRAPSATGAFAPGGTYATTDALGNFTAADVAPGPKLVYIQPASPNYAEDLPEFTEEAFKIVDQDIEPSYWPGGVSDPKQTVAIEAAAGAIVNAGTITVRKTPYYRVRIRLNGDCAPREQWILRLISTDKADLTLRDYYTACRKDALLTRIPPGTYNLAIWSGRKAERWSLTPVVIAGKNAQVDVTFNSASTISGRILGANGADPAKLGPVAMFLRADGLPPVDNHNESSAGPFNFAAVPWVHQILTVEPRDATTYVKEILYNGLPLRSHRFDLIPGAPLDVILDSGAARLNVTLKRGEVPVSGRVLLVSSSLSEPANGAYPPFSFIRGELDGVMLPIFHIPPGEYRVIAELPGELRDPNDLAVRFARAQRITLGRGEQKSIEVQVK